MNPDALMNTATALYFVCYVPEFYANYVNKNANAYNVLEKVVMLLATGFGLGYAISTQNNTLIINYAPLFGLDTIALLLRAYYAYKNRFRDVRVIENAEYNASNLSGFNSNSSNSSLENLSVENPIYGEVEYNTERIRTITHIDSDL
jgi:hypothetical protein